MATETTDLARLEPASLAPAPPNLRTAYEAEARALLKSGYFERFLGIKNQKVKGEWIKQATISEDQAVINMTTVMVFGRELRLSPIQALQHVYIVNGLPGLDFQILQAMVRTNGRGFVAMWPVVSSNAEATYHIERHDGPVVQQYDATFRMEDAKRLGLGWKKNYDTGGLEEIKDSPWQKQPDVMLLRRAGTKAMRELCGDLIQGFYSLDELGIQVQIGADREVPVLDPVGNPVIERLVVTPDQEDDAVDADFEVDHTREANADPGLPASAAEVKSFKALVKTYCEQNHHEAAAVNVWMNDRMARMGLTALADATQMQLDVLYDALCREYGS